jgi:TfoX/Sxy family transcriptional regulator of competence genes
MSWKKVPPELIEFLDRAVVPYQTERRSMFGCPVHFVNNNMFVGAYEDQIMLRLRPDEQAELFDVHPEAEPFMPMGRRMKEYAVLPRSLYENEAAFGPWLQRSYEYVSALPPQVKKAGRKKSG